MTKYCKDCRHADKVVGVYYCQHPSLGESLVYKENNFMSCSRMRNYTCGKDGKLFDPKLTLLQRLKKML